MSVRLNFNAAASLTRQSMSVTDRLLTQAMQRLSSGLRINRAADDPSGLVIADRMRHAQVGMDQATANSEQGVTMLQTAEGGMDAITSSLQRLRQLAVQAANEGAQDPSQLAALQNEFDAAVSSIDQTAQNTHFGAMRMLQGDLSDLELSTTAAKAYRSITVDATRVPAGITDGSTVTIAPPTANLTHQRVQVTMIDPVTLAPPSDTATVSGLNQNGLTLTISAPTTVTLTGPAGSQTLTLTGQTTIHDVVGLINNATARTGLRSAYDATTGALTVEGAAFGAGAIAISSPTDLTSTSAGIGFLDGDTTSATVNPFVVPVGDTFQTTLLDPANSNLPATTSSPILGLLDQATGTTLDAVAGKTLTLFANGSSQTMTLTQFTTVQNVVDWVNTTGSTLGARAAFDATTGALSITGTRGTLMVSAQEMTSTPTNVGLLDARTDLIGSTGGTHTATLGNPTIDVAFTDASGAARTVTLTQDPTSAGGLTFVNLLPGPELSPPYSGWETGAIRVTLKDATNGAMAATLAVPTASTTAIRASTTKLQIGIASGEDRRVEIPDMRSAALGLSAFRTEYASSATSKPLVTKGLRSISDLVTRTALSSGSAQEALRVIDAAIGEVTGSRGRIGALQSDSIDSALKSLRISKDNLTEAESSIRDVDFASESANLTRLQIMMQAATAMLGQANQVPQSVLQLLQHQ